MWIQDIDKYVSISPGDVVIDCGANIGDVSAYFLSRGAVVHSFEPNPSAYNILRERFKDNKNVICINKAVSDRDGAAKLFLHEHAKQNQVKYSTGCSMVSDKINVNEDDFLIVGVTDLCNYISNINKKVKFLKIDIEERVY